MPDKPSTMRDFEKTFHLLLWVQKQSLHPALGKKPTTADLANAYELKDRLVDLFNNVVKNDETNALLLERDDLPSDSLWCSDWTKLQASTKMNSRRL